MAHDHPIMGVRLFTSRTKEIVCHPIGGGDQPDQDSTRIMMFYAKLMMIAVLGSALLVGCQRQTTVTHPSTSTQPLPVISIPTPVMSHAKQPTLVGSTWLIHSIKGKRAQAYSQQPLMTFNDRAQVSGSTGCNTLFGEYSLGLAGELSVRVGMSRSNCAGALAQEADLIDAFDRTRRYELKGKTLLLQDEHGQVMIKAQVQ